MPTRRIPTSEEIAVRREKSRRASFFSQPHVISKAQWRVLFRELGEASFPQALGFVRFANMGDHSRITKRMVGNAIDLAIAGVNENGTIDQLLALSFGDEWEGPPDDFKKPKRKKARGIRVLKAGENQLDMFAPRALKIAEDFKRLEMIRAHDAARIARLNAHEKKNS